MKRRLPVGLLAPGLVLMSCIADPAPSDGPDVAGPSVPPSSTMLASPSVAPRLTPSPISVVWAPVPTPLPQKRVDGLPVTASVERDGVRVTITLQEPILTAGKPATVVTTVENTGRDTLLFAKDCDLVGVDGSMDTARWRPGLGWPGKAGEYKAWAVEELRLTTGDVSIGFTPEGIAKQGIAAGEYGCGDTFDLGRLRPGKTTSERSVWNGWATRSYAPPPSGLATLRGSFHIFWRASEGPGIPEAAFDQNIEVLLPVWVDGLADPPLVHPTEAIDLALADPVFGPWILSRPFRSGADWRTRYDAASRTWHVGLLSFDPHDRIREVLINADTGAIVGHDGPTD